MSTAELTPGLKLILSRLPQQQQQQEESVEQATENVKVPVLVLHNLGAQRCTDMVEVATVLQHFSHVALGDVQEDGCCSCCCSFCLSENSTHLSPQLRETAAKSLGVPVETVLHATWQPNSSRRARSPAQTTTTTTTTTIPPVPSLLWHYGWAFSVAVIPSVSSVAADSTGQFYSRLCELLSNFKPTGFRIATGSAAAAAAPPPPGAKTTTLPERIICSVEWVPPSVLRQLTLLATPAVKIAGFPAAHPLFNETTTKQLQLDGLFMQTDFLTREQEQGLLAMVASWDKAANDDDNNDQSKKQQQEQQQQAGAGCWQILNQRRVRHFGRRFDYSSNNVFSDKLVPLTETPWIDELLSAAHQAMRKSGRFTDLEAKEWQVDQMTVSEYVGGAGIPPHVDHEVNFGKIVVAVAVGAPTLFDFSRVDNNAVKTSVLFPPRALMVMQGKARYEWKHAISARTRDFLFFEECTGGTGTATDGDVDSDHNVCLASCTLERQKRISFTFRRVTHDFAPAGDRDDDKTN